MGSTIAMNVPRLLSGEAEVSGVEGQKGRGLVEPWWFLLAFCPDYWLWPYEPPLAPRDALLG
jgi:hypothetical protein